MYNIFLKKILFFRMKTGGSIVNSLEWEVRKWIS